MTNFEKTALIEIQSEISLTFNPKFDVEKRLKAFAKVLNFLLESNISEFEGQKELLSWMILEIENDRFGSLTSGPHFVAFSADYYPPQGQITLQFYDETQQKQIFINTTEIATHGGIIPSNIGTTVYLEHGDALRVENNNII